MSDFTLYQGDCLEVMPRLQDIDMVLADPPYGTTACKWDSIIPLEPMWECLKAITKERAAIVMTASQPFTTTLIASNMKQFSCSWVWEKEQGVNFMLCKKQPLKVHEDVLVFSCKQPTYNPQMTEGRPYISGKGDSGDVTGRVTKTQSVNKGTRYPRSIQRFNRQTGMHPTQKPVALMEYLIKTYTNPGDTVLDFTMGSGTTGVACANTGRKFVGIELDPDYFQIAKERIETAYSAQQAA